MQLNKRAFVGTANRYLWILASALTLLASLHSHAAQGAPSKRRLTIGISQEFETLNPIIMSMSASSYIGYMVNRPLVTVDANWQLVCKLCTELPTIENGKAKIFTEKGKKKMLVDWEIKPEAKWADGTPVTGRDVRLSWEIGRHPNVSVAEKDLYMRIESITIDDKNPKRFSMKLAEARYDFNQLGGLNLVPAHLESKLFDAAKSQPNAYEKKTLYTTDPTTRGLYNGPYVIKEIQLGSHVILERNPAYWGSPAEIESIVIKLIPNTQTMEANLLSGTIDMISELGISLDQSLALEKRLKRDPQLGRLYRVVFEDSIAYEHIDFNLENPFLKDVRVRKAIAHGIDRDKLMKALFDGKEKKSSTHIHPKDVYYSEDVKVYNYEPKESARLLEEAGYKKGPSGYLEKDGQKLSLNIMTTAQNKTRELIEVYMQEQLKKLGIELTITNEPARVFFGETTRKRKFPGMVMFTWTSAPDSPPRSTLHSSEIPTEQNSWSGQNYPAWRNARNDEILDQVFKEFDPAKRKTLMAEQQKLYTEDLPVLPLCMKAEIVVIPSNLAGFKLTGHQFVSSMDVEHWKLN
jgi:peptide/nickel transport system substrate-binding protein